MPKGEKRKAQNSGDQKNAKKFRLNPNNIEPNWTGIYVTCVRGKEKTCNAEMLDVLSDYTKDIKEEDVESNAESSDEDDIAASIAKEVASLKKSKNKGLIVPVDVNCECVLFFRTKKPIDPVKVVISICEDVASSGQKRSRYAQRITPITLTDSATEDSLKRLAAKVLGPHFHQEKDQTPYKYAIQPSLRNFNALTRDDIIQTVAGVVGHDHGHSVDLKNYDKLILIECFRSSIGMAVVDRSFAKYDRFNLQQILQKSLDQKKSIS